MVRHHQPEGDRRDGEQEMSRTRTHDSSARR
jgi:hypothetical protein